jgi:hypothetical protein
MLRLEIAAAVETKVIFLLFRLEVRFLPGPVSFIDYLRRDDDETEYYEREKKIRGDHEKKVSAYQ